MEPSDIEPSPIRWRLKLSAITLAAVAALCLGAGIALPFVARSVFAKKLDKILPIAPSSAAYKAWVSSEMRFQVWMWNVTNAMEVLQNASAVPSLAQVGPFTFREIRTRESVRFYANKSVAYDDVRTYYFLRNESVGNMSDYNITNVNLPYFGVALRTRDKMTLHMKKILHGFLTRQIGGNGVFTTRTVHELLVGYQDSALSSISKISSLMNLGQQVPTRFGILLGKNGTSKGSVLAGTGADNLKELNRIRLWNREPSLKLWRQDWANQVVGTDGTMFPPPVTRRKPLVIYTPDFCRSVNLTYRRMQTVQGITVLAFSPAKSVMMNATENPHNAAFCTPRCLDSGVLNLSLCLPGAPPVVASAPHFHGAPTYARAVAGVQPMTGGDFGTQLEIEPNTGLLMRAARRMQINIALEYVDGFPDTKRFGQLFLMPYLWLNESGSIGPGPAASFKQQVLWPLRLASLISWLLVALGIALALLANVIFCLFLRLQAALKRQRRRKLQRQPDPDSASINEKAKLTPPQKPEQPREADTKQQLDKQLSDAEELIRSLPETDIV